MPRKINETEYGMSHRRYRMLVDFCYLYPEWQQWLAAHRDNLGSPVLDGQPHGTGGGSPTEELALKRSVLSRNIQIIEEAAQESSAFLAEWLLKDVTTPEVSYQQMQYHIPCGRRRYFEIRKKFFMILDKKL